MQCHPWRRGATNSSRGCTAVARANAEHQCCARLVRMRALLLLVGAQALHRADGHFRRGSSECIDRRRRARDPLPEAVKAIITDGTPTGSVRSSRPASSTAASAGGPDAAPRPSTSAPRHVQFGEGGRCPIPRRGARQSPAPGPRREGASPSPTRKPRPGGAPPRPSGLGATAYAWGPATFWPANANAQNVAKSLRVDEGLADCIRSKSEVLYACDASIAVPRSLEASLRAGLGLF